MAWIVSTHEAKRHNGFVLTAALASCVPSEHKTIALQAIEQFHNQFNRSEFSEIYEGADQKAKEKISKNDFIEDMEAMRRGQGAVLRSEEIGTDYNYINGVTMVKILVLVSFEKGTAKEEFIYYFRDAKIQLASYRFLS